MLQRIRQRYSGVHNLESGGSAESAMRALELLRISVQQAFDAEVNDIIKRYMNVGNQTSLPLWYPPNCIAHSPLRTTSSPPLATSRRISASML